MKRFLREQWFLLVLIGVVVLGYSYPGPGVYLRRTLDIQWFIIPTLFMMSFSLRTSAILRSFLNLRGLASSVVGGYALTSFSLFVLAKLLFPHRADLFFGLIAVGTTPCTLASAAILTRLAGGNDALALAITIVSNLSSFVASPLILLVLVGNAVPLQVSEMMRKLFVTIVLPVMAGQCLRAGFGAWADRWKPIIGMGCQMMILLVVTVAVSHASHTANHAAASGGITVGTLLVLIAAVAAAHLTALLGCGLIARLLRAPAADVVAVMFGGSQKTLPVGIYIAEMLAASRPHESFVFIALPILIYHATQLTLDSILTGPCRRYLATNNQGEGAASSSIRTDAPLDVG